MACDSSSYRTENVLSYDIENDIEWSIISTFQVLTKAEQNYFQIDKV